MAVCMFVCAMCKYNKTQVISAKWTEWNWQMYCFHFCVSVYTQSINRLSTGQWSLWRHRCTACCCKSILRDITYIFCTFLLKPHFDLEPDCIIRKPIKRCFQQYLVRTEILSTFHTQVEYISQRTIHHSTHSNEWGCTQSSLQQCVSFPQCISHLADICTLWAPSNNFLHQISKSHCLS